MKTSEGCNIIKDLTSGYNVALCNHSFFGLDYVSDSSFQEFVKDKKVLYILDES